MEAGISSDVFFLAPPRGRSDTAAAVEEGRTTFERRCRGLRGLEVVDTRQEASKRTNVKRRCGESGMVKKGFIIATGESDKYKVPVP